MTTEDRRVRKTRQALQEALIALILEQGYESITVQDILDRANVGRSTFYAHFLDKEALLRSQFEHLQADFDRYWQDRSPSENAITDFSRVMFRHAQDYHRVYKAVVGKHSGHLIQQQLQTYLITRIQPHLAQQRTTESIPPDLLAHYVVNSFMVLLIWWLDHDLPYPPEQMDAIYQQLIRRGIDPIT